MSASAAKKIEEADYGKPGFVNGVAGDKLLKMIERIENLEEQKKQIAEDVKDTYAEAKNQGFDPKIMRKIISLRKREKEEVIEENNLLDIYMRAIGMVEFE